MSQLKCQLEFFRKQKAVGFVYSFLHFLFYVYLPGLSLPRTAFKINCSLNHFFIHARSFHGDLIAVRVSGAQQGVGRPILDLGVCMVSPKVTDSVSTKINNKERQRKSWNPWDLFVHIGINIFKPIPGAKQRV